MCDSPQVEFQTPLSPTYKNIIENLTKYMSGMTGQGAAQNPMAFLRPDDVQRNYNMGGANDIMNQLRTGGGVRGPQRVNEPQRRIYYESNPDQLPDMSVTPSVSGMGPLDLWLKARANTKPGRANPADLWKRIGSGRGAP
jgi:hypothetical protein